MRSHVIVGCALVLGVATAALVLGEREGGLDSYGSASPAAAVLEIVTTAALLIAAALLTREGQRTALSAATLALAVTWLAPVWVGWSGAPNGLRVVAMLLVPMVAPTALVVGALLVERSRLRTAGILLAASTSVAAVSLWLVRDPFLDRYCWRDCLVDGFAPWADVDRARALTNLTLLLGAACGVALSILGLVELARSSRARRSAGWALATGAVVGLALAASAVVLRLVPEEDPETALHAGLFVARALALTAFGGGLVALALRPRMLRAAVARLAGDAARTAGEELGASLGRAIGAPALRLGYPLAEGRVVDATGSPFEPALDAVRIERGGETVARVDSPAGDLDPHSLDRALGPAARLALANERLRAEQLARLRELTELRQRIVTTGDAARRRLERDLHDGAQQRLLALQLDLRVASARAEAAGEAEVADVLRAALDEVAEATAELRAIAHGIFPAILATNGLVAALETLSDTRRLALALEVGASRRLPAEIEATAYALVDEALRGAGAPVSLALAEHDGRLELTVDGVTPGAFRDIVEDRVGAAGGWVTWEGTRLVASLPIEHGSAPSSYR